MSKADAIAELRTFPSRPTGEQVQALAAKYGVTPSSVYGWAREVFGRATTSPSPGAAPPATASVQAPASRPAPASPGESAGANLTPVSPVVAVRFAPVDAAEMPQFSTPPPASPQAAPDSGQPTAPPQPAPPPTVSPQDAKLMAFGVVETMCMIVDKYWGDDERELDAPPGPITKEEKEQLAQAWGPFVVKYAPYYAQYSVEVNVALVSFAVFGPRWKYAKKRHDERVAAEKQARLPPPPPTQTLEPQAPPAPANTVADDPAAGDLITRKLRNLR